MPGFQGMLFIVKSQSWMPFLDKELCWTWNLNQILTVTGSLTLNMFLFVLSLTSLCSTIQPSKDHAKESDPESTQKFNPTMNQLQCRDSSLVGFVVLLLSFSFHTPHGYHWQVLVGVCRPVLQILTLFRNKKMSFSTPVFRPGPGCSNVG